MDMKEKLVGLLERAFESFIDDPYCIPDEREFADHLIAHGVTVQEWISVKDRLPEDVYGKDREKIVVLVRTKSGNVSQCARCADYDCKTDATLSKVEWFKTGKFYWSKEKLVTHWMPLPEPPKETICCKDCENLMFSDCYGECAKGYKGIVKPNDTCEHAKRKPPKGE